MFQQKGNRPPSGTKSPEAENSPKVTANHTYSRAQPKTQSSNSLESRAVSGWKIRHNMEFMNSHESHQEWRVMNIPNDPQNFGMNNASTQKPHNGRQSTRGTQAQHVAYKL